MGMGTAESRILFASQHLCRICRTYRTALAVQHAARRLLTTEPRWSRCTAINIYVANAGHYFVML